MARAASLTTLSSRLIRFMHAHKHVLHQRSFVIDRSRNNVMGAYSWFSSSRVLPRMMLQTHHAFGTLTTPPNSMEGGERVDLDAQSYPVSVPVEDACQLHNAGHRYLDVRTRQEFDEGHAAGAVNIPYLISTKEGMSKNPLFMVEVASEFERDDKIIVGCRSGKRSLMAVEDLRSAGYSKTTNIEGGYMAWPKKE